MPVKNRALGAVYLLFTLCFGLEPQKIIAECARALKDDGHLVIGMIPAGSIWGKHLAAKKKQPIFFMNISIFTQLKLSDSGLPGPT